ncbi:MAG TPA: segregation/condensation protein A [Clostridiales bacterium]|nr:segregation/condensation protein A [Clostridiales bacterium]
MSYHVKLEIFEGPFDLLFHLIEKEKVDIYNIPIAKITEQYIQYIEKLKELDLEVTSEFLVMAATLMEIKSKMLLPITEKKEAENAQEDPRQDLVHKLIEYKKFKNAAVELQKREMIFGQVLYKEQEDFAQYVSDTTIESFDISLEKFLDAFQEFCRRKAMKHQESSIRVHKIKREQISLEEKMQQIKELFKHRLSVKFEQLLNQRFDISEIVITFLAVLELIKIKFLSVRQEEHFGEILIRKNQ